MAKVTFSFEIDCNGKYCGRCKKRSWSDPSDSFFGMGNEYYCKATGYYLDTEGKEFLRSNMCLSAEHGRLKE